MSQPKLSKLEFQIMEALWARGEASIREIQETLAKNRNSKRPSAYTTIQTMVYRMEQKEIVQRTRKVGNFHVFSATVTRDQVQKRLLDDFLGFFGGKGRFVMAKLIEAGELTMEDVREAEDLLKSATKQRRRR